MNNTNTTGEMVGGIATSGAQELLQLDASTISQIGALTLAAMATQEVGGTTHLVLPEGHKHIDLTATIEKAGAAP